jgi:hypothetical protein
MNVIMFIIRVLKLLSMQGKYVVLTLIIILTGAVPAGASTAKIAAGAPVYLGENNLDISSALNGCHSIGWWQEGANSSAPPHKNLTIYPANTVSDTIYHFNITQDFFGGTRSWYCLDKEPRELVFEVFEPQLDIKVWDLDHDQDVSGTSVPVSTHITYRVDTNLYPALLTLHRPSLNPSDSFFTVTLLNPQGRAIGTIYTGNAGNPKTQILSFEKKPFISVSPYYWEDGKDWDRNARSNYGETLYPLGTYTFIINQNLNSMQESYTTNLTGTITDAASVTFTRDPAPAGTPQNTQQVVTTTLGNIPTSSITGIVTTVPTSSQTRTAVPATSPLPVKTTYTPLPAWIVVGGIIIAGLVVLGKSR